MKCLEYNVCLACLINTISVYIQIAHNFLSLSSGVLISQRNTYMEIRRIITEAYCRYSRSIIHNFIMRLS
jgi:hypothetical protein